MHILQIDSDRRYDHPLQFVACIPDNLSPCWGKCTGMRQNCCSNVKHVSDVVSSSTIKGTGGTTNVYVAG